MKGLGAILCVINIGNRAFEYCLNLTSVEIGENVKTIETYAFKDCSSIEEIYIPVSVTTLTECFYGCSSLEKITVDPNNPNYKDVDGVVYNKNMTVSVTFVT